MTHLLITDIFPPRTGGSGRWFWEIYRRLSRRKYAIAAGFEPRQHEFDQTHDLNLRRLPLTLPAWGIRSWTGLQGYWGALRGLVPFVQENRVRLVHAGRCLPEGVMALGLKWLYRIPYLCYVHGEDVTTANYSREYVVLVNKVLRNARLLIANSDNTRQVLRDQCRVPDEKIVTMTPGVDTKFFVPAPRNDAWRARQGWHNRPVVLTVGRLQKRKGQDMLIRALPQIRRHIPDVLYVIAGEGEERKNLEQLTAELGLDRHVHFLGEVGDAELLRCYQQCDLFVLANRQVMQDIEGFGMVLVEAQACGKPVIAGTSGGTRETMRPGETGDVVNCDAPDALARLISEWLLFPERLRQMGERGRDWVVARFDWDNLSRRAEEIFVSAAPRRRRVQTAVA